MAANEFKPDYRIAELSMLGILGMALGCIFLFLTEVTRKSNSVWHELSYIPKELTSRLLMPKFDSLQTEISHRLDTIKTLDTSKNSKITPAAIAERKAKLLAQNKSDSAIAEKLATYLRCCSNVTDADTVCFAKLNHALHFNISPDALNTWNDRYRKGDTMFTTGCTFLDAGIPFPVNGYATFKVIDYSSDISFLTKYPAAGMWILLVLAFSSFSFIAVATSIYLKNKTLDLFKANGISLRRGQYYKLVGLTLITLLLLLVIWKLSFYDDDITKDLYFMDTWRTSLYFMMAVGYGAGAFCLAGFIYKAAMLGYFVKSIKKTKKEIERQKVELKKVTDNKASEEVIAKNAAAIDDNETANNKDKLIYQSLLASFHTYFILAATILSLMVFCTAGLYTTINSLDFVKLLQDDWGYSPARPDFIYLHGGLHTLILLLVYIPAKMRFSEINLGTEPATNGDPATGKWYDFLQNPFSHLKELAIAASPFLASLIQSLFDVAFK